MDLALSQIDWNMANYFRLAAVLLEVVFILDTMFLIAHRRWRINPVLKELADNGITALAAPPLWGTAYHAIFAIWVGNTAFATVQRMTFDGASTFAVWTTPVVVLAAIVITRMFTRRYAERLRAFEHAKPTITAESGRPA